MSRLWPLLPLLLRVASGLLEAQEGIWLRNRAWLPGAVVAADAPPPSAPATGLQSELA